MGKRLTTTDPTYTIGTTEAAARLGVTPGRVKQLCRAGVGGRKVGRDWRIRPDELSAFAARNTRPGPPRKVAL